MTITRYTEWEGEHTRLVKLGGLAAGSRSYKSINGRRIRRVFIHQSAGNFVEGQAAAERIARFHVAPPKYKTDAQGNRMQRTVRGKKRDWWIGGGRGWPGIAYTFVVPAIPAMVDGKLEVYRCHDDEVVSYHTGGYNRSGVGVVMAGTYRSRHLRSTKARDPDPTAMIAMEELVLDYLLPRYGLKPESALRGHFDAGKAACPGDFLEQWVRHRRGEDVEDPVAVADIDPVTLAEELTVDRRPLGEDSERQQALIDLGFDLGKWGADGVWGEASKGALLGFQHTVGIVVDGRWGPQTEAAVRIALAELSRGEW
jgi:hypothetical protein